MADSGSELPTEPLIPVENDIDLLVEIPEQKSFLQRARYYLAGFGGVYLVLVLLLAVPFFQSHTVYLNALKFPFFADFDAPEKYGLAPNKTANLKIHTWDNETLGAWFILSDAYYHSLPSISSPPSTHIEAAVKQHPTILFLHGNAATRAFSARVQQYQAFSSRLHANVLAIDYRGFADSTGSPSEAGLTSDAKAGWDWLVRQGAKAEDILVVGHSLGTGVSGQLAKQLASDGVKCRGVVLLSPFSSIRELLNTYHLFGVIPLMRPLALIPYAPNLVTWALIHKFDTLKAVPNITADVLIAHAENDWDIPQSHSDVLFNAFLEPYLPHIDIPTNPLQITPEHWSVMSAQQVARKEKRDGLVRRKEIANFGSVQEFSADGRKVVLVQALAGGHDYVGGQEGLQDIIRKTFGFSAE